jgi:phage gp36-like protein
MRQNKCTIRQGRCKPQDINRYNWCTFENFANMYDGVYQGMVEVGIAVESDKEVMYNKNGEITTNVKEMYGRPTKYQITNPQ